MNISRNRDYRSISEFFTRQLRPDVRTISDVSCVISPVDGRVLHFGLANDGQIEQVRFGVCLFHKNQYINRWNFLPGQRCQLPFGCIFGPIESSEKWRNCQTTQQ